MPPPPLRPPSRWIPRNERPSDPRDLLRSIDIAPPVARVLAARGVTDPSAAEAFLSPSLSELHDPRAMADMGAAVDRVTRAARSGETVLVHGDYDVDGLTATALLVRSLGRLGADVHAYIPDRFTEGYGLSERVLEVARQVGASLVVTCDCGVRALTVAESLRAAGVDLIVTDHHEPGPDLPEAVAVLNPKRPDCPYPFRDLAGVGVAFKLVQGVTEALGHSALRFQSAYLDLAAMGTIADVVGLVDENRVIAARGLERLRATRKVGLRALLRSVDLADRPLDAYHVGFILAPRLNAAGRLDHANAALRLLLTSDRAEAEALARELDRQNAERQAVEQTMLDEAQRLLAGDERMLREDAVLVLSGRNWHKGVAGLVASRVRERYGRPTIVLCPEDGGVATGSGRSIEDFHLADALEAQSDLLLSHGGHAMAAGLRIAVERIGELRTRLNQAAREALDPSQMGPIHKYDGELDAHEVSHRLANDLERLAPFGSANPRPTFVTRDLVVEYAMPFGREGKHLRVGLGVGDRVVVGVLWRRGERIGELQRDARVDVLYSLRTEAYRGVVELRMVLDDFRPAARGDALSRG